MLINCNCCDKKFERPIGIINKNKRRNSKNYCSIQCQRISIRETLLDINLACVPENCRVLCRECHKRTETYGGRVLQ